MQCMLGLACSLRRRGGILPVVLAFATSPESCVYGIASLFWKSAFGVWRWLVTQKLTFVYHNHTVSSVNRIAFCNFIIIVLLYCAQFYMEFLWDHSILPNRHNNYINYQVCIRTPDSESISDSSVHRLESLSWCSSLTWSSCLLCGPATSPSDSGSTSSVGNDRRDSSLMCRPKCRFRSLSLFAILVDLQSGHFPDSWRSFTWELWKVDSCIIHSVRELNVLEVASHSPKEHRYGSRSLKTCFLLSTS